MNDFLAKLKRLFAPRPGPPAESLGEPTADRPPPRLPPPPVETAPPRVEAAPPPVEAAPSREPATASIDVDELAEVRVALEAVAEAPITAPAPETREPEPHREPEPRGPEPRESEGRASEAVALPSASEPAPAPGDALVLTLATPAATFTIARSGATVGRGQENTIRLDDLSVSRKHARIAYRQGGYWISDLGSMGGTWVDGTRLSSPHRLAASQVIDIGLCRLTVAFAGGAAADSKSSASKPRSEMAGQARRRR